MEERHLSLSEVARLMEVAERTVRRWIKSGKLRAYKPGRDYRIPESAIKELMEESEARPKVESPSRRPSPDTEAGGVGLDSSLAKLRWVAHELAPGTPAEEALTRLTTGNRGFLKRALSHVLYAPSEEEDYSGWLKDDPASTMPAIKAAVRFVDKTDSDIETVYGLVENEFTERQIEAGREGQRAAEEASAESKGETA